MQQVYDFIKDIILPLLVPTSIFFLTARINSSSEKIKEQRASVRRQLSVIDTVQNSITTLNGTLEGLKEDWNNKSYFSFASINQSKPYLDRLSKLSDELTNLSDENVGRTISGLIDELSTLISGLNDLEQYSNSQESKFKEVERKGNEELYKLRIELLSLGLKVEDLEVKSYQDKVPQESIDVAQGILNVIISDYNSAKQDLENTKNFCKDRRIYFAMRINDVQAKIRELEILLTPIKSNLITDNYRKV